MDVTSELLLSGIIAMLWCIIPIILFFGISYYIIKKATKAGIKEAKNK